jgi:hypothetical protein
MKRSNSGSKTTKRNDTGTLMLTDEDRKTLKKKKHPYFKGYFTKEAIAWRKKILNTENNGKDQRNIIRKSKR